MIVSPSCGQPLYIQRALGLGFSWAHAYGPLEPQTLLGSHLKTRVMCMVDVPSDAAAVPDAKGVSMQEY